MADQLDRRPVDDVALRARLAALQPGDTVVLGEGEPTVAGPLLAVIQEAARRGARVVLRTNGRVLSDPLKIGRLVALGLHEVVISLHGDADTHNALVGGDALAHAQTTGAIAVCSPHVATTVATVLCAKNIEQLPDLLAVAAKHGAGFELRRIAPPHPPDLALSESVWDAAWRRAEVLAQALRVPFRAIDPQPPARDADRGAPPATVDAHERARIDAWRPSRAARAGIFAPDAANLSAWAEERGVSPTDLPYLLAAQRLPLRNLPLRHGGLGERPDPHLEAVLGPGTQPLPLARPVVVVPPDADRWLAQSTLPALARALGAPLVSAFRDPPEGDPFAPPTLSLGRVASLLRKPDPRPAHIDELDDAGRAGLPAKLVARLASAPSDATFVTVGWKAAFLIRAVAPRARRIVLDPDRLLGFHGPLGPEDLVVSPWPHFAAAYPAVGIPLSQVRFRPWPIEPAHVPAAPERGGIVAFGSVDDELRDRLDIVVAPTDDLLGLRAALSAAELVWLPEPDPFAFAWAAAAGLPVVAADTACARDHVRAPWGQIVRGDPEPVLRAALAGAHPRSPGPAAIEAWANEASRGFDAPVAFRAEGGGFVPWPA